MQENQNNNPIQIGTPNNLNQNSYGGGLPFIASGKSFNK